MFLKSIHLQCYQINAKFAFKQFNSSFFLHQTYIQAKQKYKATLITFKFAFGHLQCSECQQLQPPTDVPKLQSTNPLRSILQPQNNQISNLPIWMSGCIMYWSAIGLEIKLHKHMRIHKHVWTMLGVGLAPPTFALAFIIYFQFGLYKQCGITLLPLRTNVVDLLQPQLYDYEQSNALPFTIAICMK